MSYLELTQIIEIPRYQRIYRYHVAVALNTGKSTVRSD